MHDLLEVLDINKTQGCFERYFPPCFNADMLPQGIMCSVVLHLMVFGFHAQAGSRAGQHVSSVKKTFVLYIIFADKCDIWPLRCSLVGF